jgi:hypothetical protein
MTSMRIPAVVWRLGGCERRACSIVLRKRNHNPRADTPAFFGNLSWPPFDPADPPGAFNDANIARIPAGYRFIHGADPITTVPTAGNGIPRSIVLDQNYPNPFNPVTHIGYQISEIAYLTLTVYDVLGREVATLVRGRKNPGAFEVEFNGSGLAGGVYLFRLTANGSVATRSMLLLK